MSKQKLLLVLIFSLIAGAVIGGTSAYFVASERAHNVIATSGVAIEIIETAVDTTTGQTIPFANITDAMPGGTYSKIPQVKNIDQEPVWLRVKVISSATASDGSALPVPVGALDIDFNTTDWTKNGDYYYYNSVLNPGETTPALFTRVAISHDLPNTYQDATFNVNLKATAVQTANNGTSAMTAEGWTEE